MALVWGSESSSERLDTLTIVETVGVHMQSVGSLALFGGILLTLIQTYISRTCLWYMLLCLHLYQL